MTSGVFPATGLKPARGGILDAASVHEHADSWGHWTNGQYGWDTEACPVELILADYCTNASEGIIAASMAGAGPGGWPFGIITRYQCLTIGMKLDEAKAIALRQNVAGTQKGVERELWSGASSIAAGHLAAKYLSSSLSVNVTPGAAADAPIRLGIAALEQALADCGLGAEGVIHMTRASALMGFSLGALEWDGGHLVTGLHTPVVAGVGYDPEIVRATAPPTQAPVTPTDADKMPSKHWMYATGPVTVHLGPSEIIDTEPMVNIRSNEFAVLAGRPAAVYFDSCCTFAVSVDLEK